MLKVWRKELLYALDACEPRQFFKLRPLPER